MQQPWSRGDRLAIASLLVAIIAFGGAFVVPEVRRVLGFDISTAGVEPTQSARGRMVEPVAAPSSMLAGETVAGTVVKAEPDEIQVALEDGRLLAISRATDTMPIYWGEQPIPFSAIRANDAVVLTYAFYNGRIEVRALTVVARPAS